MVKVIKSISEDYNLCWNCQYNESADEMPVPTKIICGKHSKIVDTCDEACEDFEMND